MHTTQPRQAGLLLPAFTPRREGDLGIGDTLALRGWVDWAADHGVAFLQLLPINENGTEESPYSGISSAALDPIYLACEVGEIPGLTEADIARARNQLKAAIQSPLVNYPAVRAAKRSLLELAWSRFKHSEPSLTAEFENFKKLECDWLEDYCLFRHLMEIHGESLTWDQWPEGCRTPQEARKFLSKLRTRDAVGVDHRLDFFAFVQWLCFRQWLALRGHAQARGVKLMGDVPIGISWHSCDVFFNREEFHLDWSGGSPPEGMRQDDPFFQQWGQNWGIPLYRWDHMQANGFQWWRKRIKRLTRIFQMFRLDHILGFYRIYAFPWRPERNHEFIGLGREEAAAITHGRLPHWSLRPDDTMENKAANREDGDARLRAIFDAANGAEVIAEDLGWVPEYVRPHLASLGIAGFRIPHWDCNEHGHPTPGDFFPENTFATYSTHDHDPVNGIWRACQRTIQQHHEQPTEQTGWWVGGCHNTLRILSEFAGIPTAHHSPWPPFTEGIRLRFIKALLSSNSRYAALMVTELFSLDDRFNHPGTTGGENWRYRLPWTLEEIMEDPLLRANGEKFAAIISITRRSP
ncbi:4-alpha-glucanotransferase [Luteolibacter yonseiensis]|uniref:4-alpha-glucanotransferase n=1 Tax=Luteolibacter yonseiensis TaxID=1144680 RepID=A0A934R5X6_9BACT|nr:4-alpha-glucanotransferase [Luteolibacter yonseiensis]MBK1817559.1 4-alpha-glucanotransferase [Luteolibacter yonseiensis]